MVNRGGGYNRENAADAAQTARGLGNGLLAFKLGSAGTLAGATTSIPAGTTFYLDVEGH